MMVIIVHSYTSTLKSHMTVAKLKPSIGSFEDLVESKDFKITVEKNQILTKNILVPTFTQMYKNIPNSFGLFLDSSHGVFLSVWQFSSVVLNISRCRLIREIQPGLVKRILMQDSCIFIGTEHWHLHATVEFLCHGDICLIFA